ncbi:MAG: head-tail connector protein [Lachnospiraceae bacterium]|nr:head-tail connector protein [Lachnospiraceae bacterium]
MTDDEKTEYMSAFLEQVKTYCRIDYDDDEDIITIMVETVLAKLAELIPNFDEYAMTSRQKLLAMTFVKELYDNTNAYGRADGGLSNAASTMLLSEMYGGAAE